MCHRHTVRALELYHHDLMNHLQIIDGYVKMNSLINVQQYMKKMLNQVQQEQKLFLLNTPKLTLYILQFNHYYEMIRLTYHVNIKKKLTSIDDSLYNISQVIIDVVKKSQSLADQRTNIHLTINDYQQNQVALIYKIDRSNLERVDQVSKNLQKNKQLNVKINDDNIICKYTQYIEG